MPLFFLLNDSQETPRLIRTTWVGFGDVGFVVFFVLFYLTKTRLPCIKCEAAQGGRKGDVYCTCKTFERA